MNPSLWTKRQIRVAQVVILQTKWPLALIPIQLAGRTLSSDILYTKQLNIIILSRACYLCTQNLDDEVVR